MAAQKGRAVLMKIGNAGSPETFTTIGGMRSTTLTLNDETVDVTNKDIANLLNVKFQTTLLIFKNNNEIYRSLGETTEDLIYEALKKSI